MRGHIYVLIRVVNLAKVKAGGKPAKILMEGNKDWTEIRWLNEFVYLTTAARRRRATQGVFSSWKRRWYTMLWRAA
jgi:hypothetical protein